VELGATLGADILVTWLPHERFVGFLDRFGATRDAVAVGIPFSGSGTSDLRWVGGLIVVDAHAGLRAGFGSGYGVGVVLQHEIGHVLGLAHVGDRSQLMYSGPALDVSVRDWGSGDLAGLERLGRGAGCEP
jgi:hypothetical protein